MGLLWTMVTPLLMLGIYTFVFGTVFKSRWATSSAEASPAEFAVILFTGLIIYQFLSEPIGRAPTLMLANINYVKRVVFPLEILVPVTIGTSLFHALVSFAILLPFVYAVFGGIPLTALLLPLILAPLVLLVTGLCWFLASLGTYVRDINQIVATALTALLFLAPIFFPITALPEWLQPWVALNPLSVPVHLSREVLIFGQLPDFTMLGVYTAVSIVICAAGFLWFQRTRKGFADVL